MSEERRLVTVLFADVTGSTAMGEALDPEDVRALLARFFSISRDVIEAHGGLVEKFIGDAVMAVFGLPAAHGDDARRAASAALELRDRVRADGRLGDRLPIRLAIATGEVVASRDAAEGGDFLVTGDAVNTAARLQQAAEPGSVLVAERTAKSISGFELGPPMSVELRGKAALVVARTLIGKAPESIRRGPIVGRDADLAQLDLTAGQALGQRRPYLVSIIAPAGTGKTRLLEECLDHLARTSPDARLAISQCLPYGQRLTYWPLRGVLSRLADVDEDAPPAELRRAVTSWLGELGADEPTRLAELLATTVGAGETDTVDPTSLFSAWRMAIQLAAARQPVVLVFEDLHWSSDSLLDLVEHIVAPHRDLPLLIIVLTRPELLERRPTWGAGHRNHLSLALDPLDDDSVGELVRSQLEFASPELVGAVVKRAEGNPFFAGEIVRSIADRIGPSGLDENDVEQLVATLPDNVHATVLARLDQLPAEARRVLQVGAVFGRAFRQAGVSAVDPALPSDVGPAVDDLVDRDLVRPSGADGYAFRHILIREVAYQTLPRAERAKLHAAAGRWLAGRAGGREEVLAELIAYHFREAVTLTEALGETAQPDLLSAAELWLARAADVALGAGALAETERHLRSALTVTPPERLPELWLRIAEVAPDGGIGIPAFETALKLGQIEGRSSAWRLDVLGRLLMWHTRFNGSVPEERRLNLDELNVLRTEAAALARADPDDRARAQFLVAEAFVPFWYRSNSLPITEEVLTPADESGSQALAIAERLDDATLISAALDGIASNAQERGHWTLARDTNRRRLPLSDRLILREVVDAHAMIAMSSVIMGDFAQADADSGIALAALRPGQVPSWTLHLCSWRAYGLALEGNWDAALSTAERMRQLWIEIGRGPAAFALLGFVAALQISRSRRDERRTRDFEGVWDEIRDRFGLNARNRFGQDIRSADFPAELPPMPDYSGVSAAQLERWLAEANDRGIRLGRPDIVPILMAGRAMNARPLVIECQRAIALAAGDVALLQEALSLAETIGAKPAIGRLSCELAILAGDAALAEAGRGVLRQIGDVQSLDRYEA
jgi:class 3 adenylate cyclase